MAKGPFGIINDIIGVADTVGEFIAGPDRDGLPGYIQDQYRKRCDQAANIPDWYLALSVSSRTLLGSFCDPWYNSQGTDGPVSEPPFTGGQCANISYRINLEQRRQASGGGFEWRPINPFTMLGPISLVNETTGSEVCATPDLIFARYSLTSPNNQTRNITSACTDLAVNYRNLTITRVDGLPDECGDPDPELRPGPNPPPDPGPTPGPEPTDGPDGSPFPELPIPDFPGPFGDFPVVAPPEEPVAVDPTTIPPTGGDGLPGLPDAIGAPAGEVSGGEEGEEISFGPPPDGRVWVGCSIEATVDPRLGNIPGTGPQSTVYAFVIGNVALRYGSFYGTSKRINSRFTLVGRETTAVIIDGCFVQAQPGVTLVVRPISAETCPESTC